MHVCGQTLILVDNDATVSEVNQKLVKATLKYLFYHKSENRAFCLDTYEHDTEGTEEFTVEVNDLVCSADMLTFSDKDSNLSDTLCEVIQRWRSSDFACRDIVVFTDGIEGEPVSHEKEELYYLLENSGYPVYVVMLDQENNAQYKKSLSALAVTSGGRLFETEFEGSDAEVDRQLTENIFSAMDEYSAAHWTQYEEAGVSGDLSDEDAYEEDAEEADGEETAEDIDADEYMSQLPAEGKVIYEYDRSPGFFEGSGALILAAVIVIAGLFTAFLSGFVILKKKRKNLPVRVPETEDEEEFFADYELKGMATSELTSYDDTDTMLLSDSGATRLLTDGGPLITLTDKNDRERSYKIMLASPMSVGRGNCDVVISGDDALSKRHCELFSKSGAVFVRDLSSANGTKVNKVKITEERLSDMDELTIGARTYIVSMA